MAKFTSRLSLTEMEERLGFTANSMTPPDPATERFYSDLKPVPDNTLGRLFREYEEQLSRKYEELNETNPTHRRMAKTSRVLPKMGENLFPSIDTSYDNCPFPKLPRELRERIYSFALPQRELWIDAFDHPIFPARVGDPSGFFFELGKEPAILAVSRQTRQEALPSAYRNTTFCLGDIDNVIKFLVAVGHIGRSNITSLQFSWESMNDSGPILPSSHVRCVQLLNECRRLRFLRICLDRNIFENTSVHEFMADPGIAGLCSLRRIRTLEVVDKNDESLEKHPAVKRLYEEMKKANE
ncbi:hypothetical protein EDB81DRAFT_922366 [Dactylonectria macrodidyma]|uniref:2EXR domain-containing protein n=1 Tax=Dactylonectria macrodidyma TaxID=307937 RepID=A0A9P9D5I7_9HYPO|nr:hypothetical protein EDB81DRAFT_922366 [Dactylonectria macrodidyma]